MPWKRLISSNRHGAQTVAWLAAAVVLSGCAHAINPFVDDSIPPEQMTTASERDVLAVRDEHPPVIRRRPVPETQAAPEPGDVVHWPLWFEDPFEDKGSEDGKFAWTAEDYLAMPYSFARLLLNTMGWPISAIVTPPGAPMVSDGVLSRQALGKDHDAIPLRRAGAGPTEEGPTDAQRPTRGSEGQGPHRARIETEEVGPLDEGESALFEEDEEPADSSTPAGKPQSDHSNLDEGRSRPPSVSGIGAQ